MQKSDIEAFRYWPPNGGQIVPDDCRNELPVAQTGKGQSKTAARQLEPFLRGPIPLAWLQRAANSRSSSPLKVGLVLYHLAGLKKSQQGIVITVKRCEPWGLQRKAVKCGLDELEKAGLVQVDRSIGSAPRVDILPLQAVEHQQVGGGE